MAFHVAQSDIYEFFVLFNLTYCYTHAYVSPRRSWFILGTMAALGHVVFIWFQFKEQKEMKKKNQ